MLPQRERGGGEGRGGGGLRPSGGMSVRNMSVRVPWGQGWGRSRVPQGKHPPHPTPPMQHPAAPEPPGCDWVAAGLAFFFFFGRVQLSVGGKVGVSPLFFISLR